MTEPNRTGVPAGPAEPAIPDDPATPASPADPADQLDITPTSVALTIAQVLSGVALVIGAYALGAGGPASVTWGMLASALLTATLCLALMGWGDRLLRLAFASTERFFASLMVTFVLIVLPAALWRREALEVAPWLLVGLSLLGFLLLIRATLRTGTAAGPATAPLGADPPRRRRRRSTMWLALSPLAHSLAGAALLFLLGRLTG